MDRLKADVLSKLEGALNKGLVDEEVIDLLSSFNSIDGVVTTSSCSGRYQLISISAPGDKKGSEVIGKWHREVTVEELMDAIRKWDGSGELHLLVQPLLLHIRTKDISTASRIRTMGQEAGLKFSTIRSIKLDRNGSPAPWGMVVELLGTERMEIPIDGIPPVSLEACISDWVVKGNGLIRKTKGHIRVLSGLVDERS